MASFDRELEGTWFGANIFLEPNKSWVHNKIAPGLLDAHVLVLNNLKSHLKRSKTYNRLKPTLKQKSFSEYTKMCTLVRETA